MMTNELKQLGLPTMCANALSAVGVKTFDQLLQVTTLELKAVPSLGAKGVKYVLALVASKGHKLQGQELHEQRIACKKANRIKILDTKPNYNMTFHNGGKQVGVLDFNGPEMTFSGDMDESAKLFFDFIAKSFKARLDQERADERRACEQICIDMYLSADMDTGEAAMAIAARSNT